MLSGVHWTLTAEVLCVSVERGKFKITHQMCPVRAPELTLHHSARECVWHAVEALHSPVLSGEHRIGAPDAE